MIGGADIGVLSDFGGVGVVAVLSQWSIDALRRQLDHAVKASPISLHSDPSSSDRDRAITHNEAHNAPRLHRVNNPQSSAAAKAANLVTGKPVYR